MDLRRVAARLTVLGGTLPALCLTATTARAATPEQVAIMSPVDGKVTSLPQSHHIVVGGDWSEDIAGSGAANVYARFANPTGALALKVEAITQSCSTNQGGVTVRLAVSVDGVRLGTVRLLHLAGLTKGVGHGVAPGERLGTQATGLPYNENCWTGPHVHLEPRNDSSYACYVPVGSLQSLNGGSAVGVLGGAYANGVRGSCPAGATNGLTDGLFVTNKNDGRVYRIAGGAPLYVSTWDAFGGPQPTSTVDNAYINALAPWPRDMFLRGTRTGRVFRVVSGHRYHVTSSDPYGGPQPYVDVDDWALDHCDHLRCEPFGHVDLVSGVHGGVRVAGWAMDPDSTQPVAMHVYADGTYLGAFTANESRPDVDAVFHRGASFGYDRLLPLSAGMHSICVYAINIAQGGGNPRHGCASANVLAKVATSLTTSVSATAVTYGGKVTISGTLRRTDTGAGLGGKPVTLQQRAPGSSTWTTLTTATTSSTGHAAVTVTPSANRYYRFRYGGSFGTLPVTAAGRHVAVRQRVSLLVSSSSVVVGRSVVFSGAVAPRHPGATVAIQRYKDGAWRTVRTATLTASSTYRTTITMTTSVDYLWRVRRAADADHAVGVSPSRRITVG